MGYPSNTCSRALATRYPSNTSRLPTIVDAKSYNNGFYSITWQPAETGVYEMSVLVDNAIVGEYNVYVTTTSQ